MRKQLRYLLRNSHGATAVEYAILLGLIFAGIGLAGLALQDATGNSFQQVAHRMHGGNTASASLSDQSHDGSQHLANSETNPPLLAKERIHLLIELGLFTIGVTTFVLLLRRRRQKRINIISDDDELYGSLTPEEQIQIFKKRQKLLRILSHDITMLLDNRFLVRHLASTDVISTSPSTPVGEIAALMEEEKIHHLFVVDNNGILLGTISDQDLALKTGQKAAQVMTCDPLNVADDMPVGTAVTSMINNGVSCLPVVHDGQLFGIITRSDLIMALQCMFQVLSQLHAESELFEQLNQPTACSPSLRATLADE